MSGGRGSEGGGSDLWEHPLSKHPLTTDGNVLSEEMEKWGGVQQAGRGGGTSGAASGGDGIKFEHEAHLDSRMKAPLEFDGDDKLQSRIGRSLHLVSASEASAGTSRFVEVKAPPSSSAAVVLNRTSVSGIRDPLRHKSPDTSDELSARILEVAPSVDASVDLHNHAPSEKGIGDVKVNSPEGETLSTSGVFLISSPDPRLHGEDGRRSDVVIEVRRSIADFVWLETRLRARYEGLLVPMLPNTMTVLGWLKFGESYPVARRLALQFFLRRVIAHPQLEKTEEVKSFLGHIAHMHWQKIRQEPIQSPGDKAIATSLGINSDQGSIQNLLKWISYRFWQIGRRVDEGLDMFLKKGREEDAVARDVTAKSLEQLRVSFEALGKALLQLRHDLLRHVEVKNDLTNSSNCLRDSIFNLAGLEKKRSARLLNMISGAIALDEREARFVSLESNVPVTAGEQQLLQVLKEYTRMFEGVRRILNRRLTEREAYEHAVATYTSLRKEADREGHDSEKLERLRDAAERAGSDLADVRRHYQDVINVSYAELQKYRHSLSEMLAAAFKTIAEEQVARHRRKANEWEELLAELKNPTSEDVGSQIEYHANTGRSEPERKAGKNMAADVMR